MCNRDCFNCTFEDCIDKGTSSDKHRENSKAYYHKYREKYLEYGRKYREQHREYYRNYLKEYNSSERTKERKRLRMRELRKGVTNMNKCHRDVYIDSFIGQYINVLDFDNKWHKGFLKGFEEGRYILVEKEHDFAFRKTHIKKIEEIGA